MNDTIERQFASIGANVRVHDSPPPRRWSRTQAKPPTFTFRSGPVPRGVRFASDAARRRPPVEPAVDVILTKQGETFDLLLPQGAQAEVVNRDPADRHLLLMLRKEDGTKSKFLCGHDERHWFVAAIPETASVGTVAQAKEALQPQAVRDASRHLPRAQRLSRHNSAYQRQGEWFFVPAPGSLVDSAMVLRDEPLTRGRGKPHMAEFLYRSGGETVYVGTMWEGTGAARKGRNITLSQTQYNNLPEADRKKAWRVMRRDADVLVMGDIRHPDHATLTLNGWHRVVPNTEAAAKAMRLLAFID